MKAKRIKNDISVFARQATATVFAFIFIIALVPAYAAAPGAPVMVTAWASGSGQATVIFNPPAYDGGKPITSYTVTSNPGGLTASGSMSPITVSSLTYSTYYTFAVTATNDDGTSGPSGASGIVIARPFASKTGTINNIVVFVRFSDQPEFQQPLSYYDGLFNSAANSLKNFYLENSYNALTINSYLYPSSNGTTVSYQDQHPAAYYAPYNSDTNTDGYTTGTEGTARATALVQNALNSISFQIPDTLELDRDHDGYVDHITFMVYSSAAHPQPVMFYSKATFDTTGTVTLKGLPVASYTWVTASEDDPGMYPGATAIHETGHSLGYPDLRANSGRAPVGEYDVMSLSAPVHSGAYMKHRFTGWIPEIPEITSYGPYSINDITQPTNNSYKIKIPNSLNEYLILEYRKATGPFESHLPGSGLCITRVNEAAGIWGNLGGPPFHLYYYRVDGTLSNDGAGTMFVCLSSDYGRTQFNDHSNPACFLSDGSPCGISIGNIGPASGSSITFSFVDPNSVIITHNISGSVKLPNGDRVLGATVTLSGDNTGVTTTDNSGHYSFTVNDGGTYTITPSKTNLTFNPINASFINVTTDKTQNFAATNNTNKISGIITSGGTPLSGVTVSCSTGYCPPSVITDETGAYSFTVDSGGNYDISPGKANYYFTPYKKTYTNITTDQVQNYTTWTATVALTGTIDYDGSPLSGVSVSCPGANTTTPITTDGSGNYSFTVTVGNGSVYTVTPSKSLYYFSPANRFYTGLAGSQTQNFTAASLPGSTTTLASSANPSITGHSVTFTASVTGSTPTGTVTFSDSGTAICSAVALSNNQAQCTTNSLGASSHSVVAVYSGDSNNAGSTAAAIIQVVDTVPGAPASVSATAGNARATITFSAPAPNGGSTITGYTVTSSSGSRTAAGSASPITISGLTNGLAYTFTVTASNSTWTSLPSGHSNSVTPLLSYNINVTSAGNGMGSVTSAPAGINCPGNCSGNFTAGPLTLSAVAATGSVLAGWRGCSSVNSNQCAVTVTADTTVTPIFDLSTCNFNLGASYAAAVQAGGSKSVNIAADAGCAWTVSSNAPWISIISGSGGTGNGTVQYTVDANNGSVRTGNMTIAGKTFTVKQGTTLSPIKIGVFRPSTGEWYLDLDGSGGWSGCGPDSCIGPFGMAGDIPIVGDWNNSGTIQIGIFRPSTGMWYLDSNGSGTWSGCGPDGCYGQFGMPGDYPVAGDWTGTGTTKIGVFRPSTGVWYFDLDGSG